MARGFFESATQKGTKKSEDNTLYFFTHFPPHELWRLFVEANKFKEGILAKGYICYLINSIQACGGIMLEGMSLENIGSFTIEQLAKLAELNKANLAAGQAALLASYISDLLKGVVRRGDLVRDIEKWVAWEGFELREDGYLRAMANGLAFLLTALNKNKELDLDFILSLHAVCLDRVQNCNRSLKPGELKGKRSIGWRLIIDFNTYSGIEEILSYMKTDGCKALRIMDFRSNELIASTTDKSKIYVDPLTRKIMRYLHDDLKEVYISTCERQEGIESSAYLTERINHHLSIYKCMIAKAKTKNEYLTAIFTFIKFTVLHHPFADGVGRTMSMLLAEYLLMQNGLLPVVWEDSNYIPGWSVKEMVAHYLQLEEKMRIALDDSSYFSSETFSKGNVDTMLVLKQLPQERQDVFNKAVEIMRTAINWYLGKRNQSVQAEGVYRP